MTINVFLVNIAVIIIFGYLYGYFFRKFRKSEITFRILSGIIFGLIAVLSMIFSFKAGSGVIFDGRSIILSIAGLTGGILVSVVAVVVAVLYRFYIGGGGVFTGCLVIVCVSFLGVLIRYIGQKRQIKLNYFRVYLFGLAVHILTLGLFVTLPKSTYPVVVQEIWKPFLLIFPVVTVLVYFIFIEQEKNINNALEREISEKKYRNLFNNMNEGFALHEVVVDNEGRPTDFRLLDANPAYERLLNAKKEFLIGKSLKETVPILFDDSANWVNLLGLVGLNGNEFSHELYSEFFGKWFYIHAFSPQKMQFAITFSDISARKNAEMALGESEKQFHAFFDNSIDAMLLTAPDGRIFAANSTACQIFRRSEEELIKLGRSAVVVETDPRLGNLLKEREKTGKARGELTLLRGDGSTFPAELSSSIFTDSLGNFKTSMIVRDITERKNSEKTLRTSEAKYRALVEQSLTGIYIFEKERFLYVNNRFCEMFGYTSDELLKNLRPVDVVIPDDRQSASENIRKRLSGEIESVKYIARGLRKDQNKIWIEIHGTHIKLDDKDVITGTVLDITERKIAEEKLRDINAELELKVQERTTQLKEANVELEAFAYSVSHDLRAPLRTIEGFARILNEDYGSKLGTEGQHNCQVIQESARKMGRLIGDLLEFSRVNRFEIQASNLDMKSMVEEIYFELTNAEQRKSIEFQCNDLHSAKGDEVLIRQVWTNLISNAVKFSSKKTNPKITVSSRKDKNCTEYSVTDNGAGFNPKYSYKLFSVFQRLHSAKEFDGTGVGLAIAERIIKRHGGKIWAEGEIDKGAVINFTLLE